MLLNLIIVERGDVLIVDQLLLKVSLVCGRKLIQIDVSAVKEGVWMTVWSFLVTEIVATMFF